MNILETVLKHIPGGPHMGAPGANKLEQIFETVLKYIHYRAPLETPMGGPMGPPQVIILETCLKYITDRAPLGAPVEGPGISALERN